MNVEAKYYTTSNSYTECQICPHSCKIKPGKLGLCRSRKNENGKLWVTNYGKTTSIALDPIEKKPLYHYYPGAQILSISCNSCNMLCPFCQNWEISQNEVRTEFISPEMLVKITKEHASIGVAYTYTEPLTWYEYLIDAGTLLHKEGKKNVLVTNGLVNEGPLRELIPLIDAMNIDLKTMNPDVYKTPLGGDLDTVKKTIEIAHSHCHIEITNLLVTGLNDRKKDIDKLIEYVASIDKNIPLHFSRYYPNYKYEKSPTPMKKLEYAYTKAKEQLSYVYLGNILTDDGSNTYCGKCGSLLIERMYFKAMTKGLKGNKCVRCGEKVNIVNPINR